MLELASCGRFIFDNYCIKKILRCEIVKTIEVKARLRAEALKVYAEKRRLTCMEDPSATPIAKSILFFTATKMAVMCSQALPAIGRMMRPKKRSFSPDFLLTSSTAPVKSLQMNN